MKKNNKKRNVIISILCEIFVISFFVAGLYACLIKYDVVPTPSVRSISNDFEIAENVNIGIGEKFNASIGTYTPERLSWRSSDEKIATVEDGLIEGVGIGDTYVSVETPSGVKKTIYVYVNTANMINRDGSKNDDSYVIRYNSNGGAGSYKSTTCKYGNSCAVSGSLFTKTGYTFIGWTTKSDGTNDGYNWTGWSGTWKYKNGQYGVVNNTLTLYAMWDKESNAANRYTITYNMNGGTGSVPGQVCVVGKYCVIQTVTPTRTGYTFSGWATNTTGKAYNWTNWKGTWKYTNGKYGINNNKLVLYARWKKIASQTTTEQPKEQAATITIKYMPNGGSGNVQTQTCTYGQRCEIKANMFTRSGYTFTKWRTTSSTSVKGYNWTNWKGIFKFTNGQYGINNNTLTLYATWVQNETHSTQTNTKYTIKYMPNGGSGSVQTQTCTYGEKCTIKGSIFTRSGYKFTKWRTTSSTSTPGYNWTNWSGTWKFTNGKYGIENNTLTLYATWTKEGTTAQADTYKITYNANGGQGNMAVQTCTYGKTCSIKTCSYSKQGYKFIGWTTNSNGTDDKYNWTGWSGTWTYKSGQYGINGKSLTLYARWDKQSTGSQSQEPAVPTKTGSKIHFISTGSSDAILIESNGKYGLVDTSYPSNEPSVTSSQTVSHVISYLNSQGVKRLDFIIATHNHSDHIGGVPEIAAKFVDSNTTYYYRPYGGTKEDTTTNWNNSGYATSAVNAIKAKTSKLVNVTGSKPTFSLGDFSIRILNTETASSSEMDGSTVRGENKNSIVAEVTYKGKHKTLLAGDLETEDEPKIASSVGKLEILKLGHHSYDTATSMSFAVSTSPKNVIVTNTSVQPNPVIAVLGYLQNSKGTNVYVTGKTSDAVVVTYTDSSYSISPGASKQGKYSYTTDGNWRKVNNQYWIYLENGTPVSLNWKKDNGKWYYLDIRGVMLTGWQQLPWNGATNWYYFNSKGEMLTGWQKLSWSGGTNWFYFTNNGDMVKSKTTTIDGESFTFNSNGVCTKGRGC